jgi:hypothetical protein
MGEQSRLSVSPDDKVFREVHRLKLFKNSVVRKILGHKERSNWMLEKTA